MRKLGVFVVMFVFLSASQVLAAPDLTGTWEGEGVFASQAPQFFTGYMRINILEQQEAPGGALFRGTLLIFNNTEADFPWSNTTLNVTGSISIMNSIHITAELNGEPMAVLSGQYLGRAINVVFQDLTGRGVTGAFSLGPPPRIVGPPGEGPED